MLNGLSGSLLSRHFAEHLMASAFRGRLGEQSCSRAYHRFSRWWRTEGNTLGPASSARAILDRGCAPVVEMLGFARPRSHVLGYGVALVTGLWTDDLDALWRNAVRTAIGADTEWCLCSNGRHLRLVDARRTYSRAYLQFDFAQAATDQRLFAVFWGVLRADMFAAGDDGVPLVLGVLRASARHGESVGAALRYGVVAAVNRLLSGLVDIKRLPQRERSQRLGEGFDESLTVVYRVLFLMFAEARGLVPSWHPVYRERYTIEAIRNQAETPDGSRGLWEALQAIARLAHAGCHAGTLVVPAFNGRLFSPDRAPLAESCVMSDDIARDALLALSTALEDRKAGRVRIDYRDLGVEQLGAVYESILDYVPGVTTPARHETPQVRLQRGGRLRKATGSFYTPQSITDYVVRRTLHPLTHAAGAAQILNLRILDPAMGSAAFLVAACRYLTRAYEQALVREGQLHANEIDDGVRAGFRRRVAQSCLYGVDLNPTAVQLARLSLWLATLAAGKPLTFLDHRLMAGNSLIGASPIDLARRPPPGSSGARRPSATPLLVDDDLEPSLVDIIGERRWLADTPDENIGIVREKERRLEQLAGTRWKAVADLWCACWMWPDSSDRPDPALFAELSDTALGRRASLPRGAAERFLTRARSIADAGRFFHWMLEFPEVHFDAEGKPHANPGFDAVIGNPPWDMLRADAGSADEPGRRYNILMRRFVRDSGIYRFQGGGHVNRYQVFLERAMHLVRRGGRLGLVLPSGIATDHTSSLLRRRLLEHHDVETMVGFDNRRAIFPIHRSTKFVACIATAGGSTRKIGCRFGVDDPLQLDSVPDDEACPDFHQVALTPALIARVGGEPLTIPSLRSRQDVAIVERIAHQFPRLGDADGWNVQFGRELNATDDRRHFSHRGNGLPVLEGKHIEPFTVHLSRSSSTIAPETVERLVGAAGTFRRARLAYRDVASATNRVSLIAAVLPADVVTTHTLVCLKTQLRRDEQDYLCGMLNSYVGNYLVRQVMTTHLGSTTVENLRVPKLPGDSGLFVEIGCLAHLLSTEPSVGGVARLQARAARAYDLLFEEFRHVLDTFPLVPEDERRDALNEFAGGG